MARVGARAQHPCRMETLWDASILENHLHIAFLPNRNSVLINARRAVMDDDKTKGIIAKTIEAVEEFASEVSDAAKHLMDPPEPLKPGDEVVMMPMADDGMFGSPMSPQFMVIHRRRKSRAKKVAKKTPKTPAQTTKKSAKKAAKRVVSPKKATKSKAKSATKKTAKKIAKKKMAKKSRR